MSKTKIVIDSRRVEVTCEKDDLETKYFLMNIPHVHVSRNKRVYTTTIKNIATVLKHLRGVDDTNIHTAPASIENHFNSQHLQDILVDILKSTGPTGDAVVNEYLTLMPHQQLARELAAIKDHYAFFYDTRTGKTPLSLTIMNDDIEKNPNNKWLVVCPLILIENAWMTDAAKFFPDMKIVNCHAANKEGRLKRINTEANVYVTNTESFVRYKDAILTRKFAGCIVDESSDMKSTKSKISAELINLANTIKRFYLLSGTPAPNGAHEYYMQLKAIDYFGTHEYYKGFKDAYFNDISKNPKYDKLILKPEKEKQFFDWIAKYAIYVDKADVLDLPGRTLIEETFELPKDLLVHYKSLKNDLYIDITDKQRLTAPSVAAKLNKLNQVTSGFIIDTLAKKENKIYKETKDEWYLLNAYRFDLLENLLERIGDKQVLIWANYRVEFEIIKQRLGSRCLCVYGATSLNDKLDAINKFKSGEIQYLVANPASADKGLTLTNAHNMIYFSLNWSYELFKQSMDRIYGGRHSQPNHCYYYFMIAESTIDRVLYSDVLQGKENSSYAILNHLKAGNE